MYIRGQSYRQRFGSAFPIIAQVLIDAVMPLCAPLVEYHFGLNNDPPPNFLHKNETRWLEGLAKGHLEGAFAQLMQIERYGGTTAEMKAALFKRVNLHPPLRALFTQFEDLQRRWVSAAAPVFGAKLPYSSPDKLILNTFLTQWIVSAAHELEILDRQGKFSERQKLKEWILAVFQHRWCDALLALNEIDHLRDHDEYERRVFYILSDSVHAAIHGRWAHVYMILKYSYQEWAGFLGEEAFQSADPLDPKSLFLIALNTAKELVSKIQPVGLQKPFEVGEVIGARQWQLLSPIGDEVWQGIDGSGVMGALEEIWPIGDQEWMEQTQTEALALSQITHDNLASIIDWGIDPSTGRWYMSYPFVPGQSLRERIQTQGPLSEAQTRSCFLKVINVLKHCMRVNISHRQLRPESLIFYTEEQIVVTRFGVHRNKTPVWLWSSDLSKERRRFIAPEILESTNIGVQADIYSIGALIAFALCPQSTDIEDLPPTFYELVKKATSLDPAERHDNLPILERELRDLKTLYNYRGEFGERDALGVEGGVIFALDTFQHHPRIQNLILFSDKGLKCVYLQN